jgi:hypothetical protein
MSLVEDGEEALAKVISLLELPADLQLMQKGCEEFMSLNRGALARQSTKLLELIAD